MNTTITLTESEVIEALHQYHYHRGYRVKSVKINVELVRKDRPGEIDRAVFQNAKIEVDLDNPPSQLELAGH